MSDSGIEVDTITAVILAGGKGTRLGSSVADRPKVMAEVDGRPFITYLMDQLDEKLINKVVFCTGYMADFIENRIGYTYKGLDIIYSEEKEPLGTAGALKNAQSHLDSEYILVMNGDSFVEYDLHSFIMHQVKQKTVTSIVLTKVEDVSRYGEIEVNSEGEVKRFTEKGDTSGSGWINAGVYLMKKEVLNTVPDERRYSLEKQFFPTLVGKGLCGYQIGKRFIDIGTPESFEIAGDFFKNLT